MELSATTRVAFPRDLVFRTYRDEIVQAVPYLPNVESIVETERATEGPIVRLVNLWRAKSELPALARRFISAEMLSWTDVAVWDPSAWRCDWRIETHAFPGLMGCQGQTEFLEDGAQTQIRIHGDLTLHLERAHVPHLLVGTLQPRLERLIVSSITPNLLRTGEGVERLLLSRKAP